MELVYWHSLEECLYMLLSQCLLFDSFNREKFALTSVSWLTSLRGMKVVSYVYRSKIEVRYLFKKSANLASLNFFINFKIHTVQLSREKNASVQFLVNQNDTRRSASETPPRTYGTNIVHFHNHPSISF